jgi:hypothetical protein
MRNLCATVLAALLVTTSAFAASSNDGPLAPGKPAGVQAAQSGSTVALIIGGTAAFAMLAAMVGGSGGGGTGGSNNPNGGTNTPVTTST